MPDRTVERLFSLLTSSDRAEAMAGDLAQERQQRGWIWFWLHVVSVTFALWRSAVLDAPLRLLALTLVAGVLFTAPAFAGVAAVFLFPLQVGSVVSWIALALFWWGGGLWVGASLVSMAPRRGMPACAIVAVVGAAVLIAIGLTADPRELSSPVGRMFYITALGTTVALLAGSAIARRAAILVAAPFAVTLALVATVLFLTAAATSAHQTEWKDPSPHKTTMVTVEEGVQLEVLDWGGSGPELVLLAGGGAAAHQYDDFAPLLTARYRVIAVTRRSHRGSTAPPGGYGFARLAEDIVRVMDAMGVKNPVVIGHSFAGEEMHVLGARYSARVRGLVYVDAAFDRGDDSDGDAYNAASKPVPAAPGAQADDLKSFATLRARIWRSTAARDPRRSCAPGTGRILTGPSPGSGLRTHRFVKP